MKRVDLVLVKFKKKKYYTFAIIVAALGELYNKASSPKDSPGL